MWTYKIQRPPAHLNAGGRLLTLKVVSCIDKTDFLCYNTDMNDIVFAGTPTEVGEHRHKGWEIINCSSRGEINAGGRTLAFKRGDVIVIPRQTAHINGEGSCVIMENTLIAPGGPCVLSGEGAEDIAWVCRRAWETFEGHSPKRQVLLDGFGALLRSLIAAYCGGNGYSPAVKNVLAEIDRGVSDALFSLENCIKGLPLNYDYVRKLFRREVGLTPLEYLTAKRMSLAREIMLSGVTNRYSNYTVSQIAEMCGFAEPLYFSRVFKKYYGVSPTEYMALNR